MAEEKAKLSLIRTKLHRPSITENCVHRPDLIKHLDKRLQRPATLVSAPAGYGKTTLVSCWLEMSNTPSAWVSLDKNDNDLGLFMRYFLAAIQTIFPDAGRKTLALVNALTLPSVSVLVGSLVNELHDIEQPFILVLDDYYHIREESVHDLLTELLRHPPQSMHLVVISRRDPHLPISKLRAQSLMTEIRTQDLCFSRGDTNTFLELLLGTQIAPSMVTALHKKTEGWVTGLRLAVLSMRHRDYIDPNLLEPQVDVQYVMEYLFSEIFSHQPPEISQYLMGSAILDRFCGPLCEAVRVSATEPLAGEIDGWGFIKWLQSENMFVISLDAENRWFRYHHLFQKLLLNQLKRHSSREEIDALHAQASAWFAEEGLIEEAFEYALAGRDFASAAQLVALHGLDLLDQEEWQTLDRWLRLIPHSELDQDPELLLMKAWTQMIYARYPEMMTSLDKAEALFADKATSKHAQGFLNALRGFQHYLSAKGEQALTCVQRAIENIPHQHHWPRAFSYSVKNVTHQMLGDRESALSTLQEARRAVEMQGSISQGFLQANPCFFHWMEADLTAMLQTAERSLKIVQDSQKHQQIAHSLYFLAIAQYHRNELKVAKETLVEVVRNPYDQHAWNFAHSSFALALIYQAQGQSDQAREVSRAVITYALDMNNTSVNNLAQAFRAELALRQGRISVASKWMKRFSVKPFTPAYRFYYPPLTVVETLLAQDTMASRRQAADLLDQLHAFLTSIHNIRFQIDVLALQGLLFDTLGDGPVAREKVAKALALAEPSSFIRLFVDLGPQMADLLKSLHSQNVAVDYIEKLLAAFGEQDEQVLVQDVSGAQAPLTLAVAPQSLKDPLTNRELDVLELLAQRLNNKEIAAKLFLSPETVKSHLKNLYGKLQVGNRREAAEKAKALGILSRR